MLVKQEQLNPCEVELEVEVDAGKVQSAIDNTYDDIARETTVPGFRKGKAPKAVLRNYLDPEKVKDRAASALLRKAYSEALEESKLDPYAPADVDLVKFDIGEPMVFKAKVPLAPKVELGDYVGIEVERSVREVTDEEVDKQVDLLRDREAEWVAVTDRPVQKGDTAHVTMSREDDEDQDAQRPPLRVLVGENLPEFDDGLVGMSPGEEKQISITYPEDYGAEDLRGQTRVWNVSLASIETKSLPELTDEWVKSTFGGEEGDDTPETERIDTVEKLKKRIRESMERAAVDDADAAVHNSIVEKVVKNASICFPEFMVNETVDARLNELVENLNERKVTLDDYLSHTKMTMEDLEKRYAEEAKSYLELLLVFREITQKEDIQVTDEDLNAEIAAVATERGTTPEAVRAYIDKTDGEESIRNRILRKKVVDFLVNASNIKNVGR